MSARISKGWRWTAGSTLGSGLAGSGGCNAASAAALLSSTSGLKPANRESVTAGGFGSSILRAVERGRRDLHPVEPHFLCGVGAGRKHIDLRRHVLIEAHPRAPRRHYLAVEVIRALPRWV